MKITSNLIINGKTRSQALSQFRFLRLHAPVNSTEKNDRNSNGFTEIKEGSDNITDLSKIPPLIKNINRSLTRLDFLEQALAGASYQAALESAARMIQPSPKDFTG